MKAEVDKLADFIKDKVIDHQRYVVGIDGLSRSGKTTFANELGERLEAENILYRTIHMDDHIVEREKRYDTGQEEWYEYYRLQWNVMGLREELFEKIRNLSQVTLDFYDKDSDTSQRRTITLPENGLIIIEGVFLQRSEWKEYFDYMVYLDCPREKRFLREKEAIRANISKFINRYWKAEEYYIDKEQPIENADMVVDG
ncbi:kinase [Thalassobacillus devorans]|uniref:kinase n=1 Tax=Thalassobacillus devorans TaxID=279813 RepID=UPI000685E147|nr:kinase [Thalassobacillus devorans]